MRRCRVGAGGRVCVADPVVARLVAGRSWSSYIGVQGRRKGVSAVVLWVGGWVGVARVSKSARACARRLRGSPVRVYKNILTTR